MKPSFKTAVRKIYDLAVNLNQFYRYGGIWIQIGFNFISAMGSIGIIIIYLKIPQSPELLVVLSTLVIVGTLVLGTILFTTKGQQVDRIMDAWRTPVPQLLSVAMTLGTIELFKKFEIQIPSQVRRWGVKSWDDVTRMTEYVLRKGEDAYALSICQKFFEDKIIKATEEKFRLTKNA